jgi:hypothetical protein
MAENIIDKLVSDKALKELEKLDGQLTALNSKMEEVLKKVREAAEALSKAGTVWAELSTAIEKHVNAEQEYININRQGLKIQQEIEKLRQQEEKSAQHRLKTQEEEIRLALLKEKSNRTLMTDDEKRAKQEEELTTKINMQVKSIQDLMTKNNALNQVRRNLNLTTAAGREEYIKLTKAIKENEDQLKKYDKEIGRHQRNVGNYQSALAGLGKTFLGFLGITSVAKVLTDAAQKIKDFVSEGMKMAAAAEGISTAFNKISAPGLLDNLRRETKGLVSDMTLMQSAVQAKNFSIPIESLGKLLKFAQQRAQETGQSVDYLTNSIIMGLGRKSPLILDNLGISAVRLREEAKKSGNFMKSAIKIVNEELEKQGTLALTSADKGTQAAIKWENAQLKLGQRFLGLRNAWNKFSSEIADSIADFATKTFTAEEAASSFNREAARQEMELNNIFNAYKKANEGTDEKARLLDLIKTKYGKYISNLIDEKGRITDIDLAQRLANGSLREGLALKLKSDSINKIQNQSITKQQKLYEKIRKELQKQKPLQGTEDVIIQGMAGILGKIDTAKTKEEIDKAVDELDDYLKEKKVRLIETRLDGKGGTYDIGNDLKNHINSLKISYREAKSELDKIDLSFSPFISKEAQAEADKEVEMRKRFNEMTKEELDKYIKINRDAKDKYIEIAREIREVSFGGDDESGSEKQKREREKKEREEAKNKQAAIQAEIEGLKKLAAEQGAIYLNEKNSYDQRMAALQTYYAYTAGIREKEIKKEEAGYEVSDEKIKAVNAEGDRKETEDLNKHNSEVEKITKDHFKKLYKENQEYMADKEELNLKDQQAALSNLSRKYKEDMTKNVNNPQKQSDIEKKYQQDRRKIIHDSNMQLLNDQISFLDEQLSVFAEDADMQEKIQHQIGKARKDIIKEMAGYEIEQNEHSISEMKTAEEQFNKFMSDKRTQAVMGMWQQALDIANMYYKQQIQQIDDAEAREKESYDERLKNLQENLDAGLLSEEEAAARKRIIEEEQLQKEKQYEEQRKAMQKKQAVWQKAEAIVQATINTAQAVTAAYTVPVVGTALAAIIAGLGAAQIAMIASQKVPEYRGGTKDRSHPGGPAIVGDGGKSEMVIFPSGEIWKTPARDTLVSLPKGTEVLPDFKKAFENIAAQPVMIYRKDEGRGETVILHDDVQRNLLKNSNDKLSAIHRSLGAIRQNSMYSNSRKQIENFIKNY